MGWTKRLRLFALPGCLLVPTVLAGCGAIQAQSAPASDATFLDQSQQKVARASASGGGLFDFSLGNKENANADAGGALGVNAYLWRGALDTLSFMPLASADPFGGVIITDWYQPPASVGERFKATAYILGRQLRADGVRVTIFRQVQQGGQWVDAPVDSGTAADIENKVLARARELRIQSAGNS